MQICYCCLVRVPSVHTSPCYEFQQYVGMLVDERRTVMTHDVGDALSYVRISDFTASCYNVWHDSCFPVLSIPIVCFEHTRWIAGISSDAPRSWQEGGQPVHRRLRRVGCWQNGDVEDHVTVKHQIDAGLRIVFVSLGFLLPCLLCGKKDDAETKQIDVRVLLTQHFCFMLP